MTEVLIYLVTLACLLWAPTKADKKIFCYYSSFAQSRQGMARFLPEDINPQLCTHVLFAFVDVSPDGRNLKPSNRNHISRGGKPGLYERTVALKQRNPDLKVLLAVGGWAQGSKQFVPMMSSVENRQAWVRNVVRYLRKYGFDGLDMDWEFPGARGSPPEDKQRFTKLMKELQEAFRSEAQISGKDKLLLTLATAGGMYFISKSYEPELLIPHVDYFLLMAYNYHGMWEKFTGHHSGLYPRADEKDRDRELNQQWTIEFWLGKGARKEQIIVGIATYSMTFTLRDPTQHGLMAPATGAGEGGKYTREPGVMAYYEICQNLRSGRWNRAWIADQMSPYYYGDRQWGGYDDVESVTYKAENIMSRNLGGAFVWSVEMDDFSGKGCNQGPYPLLTRINEILRGNYKVGKLFNEKGPQRAPTSRHENRLQSISKAELGYDTHGPHRAPSTPGYHQQGPSYQGHGPPRTPNQRPGFQPFKPVLYHEQTRRGHPSSIYTTRQPHSTVLGHTGYGHARGNYPVRIPPVFSCPSAGLHGDVTECGAYYVCIRSYDKWVAYRLRCPSNLQFNAIQHACYGICH